MESVLEGDPVQEGETENRKVSASDDLEMLLDLD